MEIKNIKINSYGILKEKEINLKNNINIIYGKNESGKSTLLNFIKNIFYGISKNKNGKEISDYEKYTPWEGENFSGKIKYQLNNGDEFEVYRDLHKKNPKIFNENLEDISDKFKIDKKDGNQFFTEQTGVNEQTYISTIMSAQKEVILDKSSQNELVQRMANLGNTGDEALSFQRVLDRLNKRQLEEVGTNRTQDRPINILQKRKNELDVALKTEKDFLEGKENLQEEKSMIMKNLEQEKNKNNLIREIEKIIKEKNIELEKNNLKIKIKNDNEEKIKKIKNEKNNLNNNLQNLQNKLENKNKIKDEIKNSKKEKNIFLIIFILIIILNIFNYIFNPIKILKYILLIFIPIEFLIYFLINKNKKIKIKNEVEKEEENIKKEITGFNSQINLLETEIQKLQDEIQLEKEKIINKIEIKKEELKNKYYYLNKYNTNENKFDINKDDINENNINNNKYFFNNEINSDDYNELFLIEDEKEIEEEIEKSNKKIMELNLELNHIQYDEKNILEKAEELVLLKEEKEDIDEKLSLLEEKNKYFEITKEFIEKAYEKMKNNVTPKFTQNLSNIAQKISNGKYKKVSINQEKGLVVETEKGEYIPVGLLSTGTIDQLYLSLRLSMLDEISKEKMPIILDEAFAYYDDERLKNILLFLSKECKDHQVILFTCHNREKEILEKEKIDYNWVEL